MRSSSFRENVEIIATAYGCYILLYKLLGLAEVVIGDQLTEFSSALVRLEARVNAA